MTRTVNDCLSEIETWRDGYDSGHRCAMAADGLASVADPPETEPEIAVWAAGWKAGYSEGSATGETTTMLAACAAAVAAAGVGGTASSVELMPLEAGAARALIAERLAPVVQTRAEQVAAEHAELLARRKQLDEEWEQRRCKKLTGTGLACRFDSGHKGRCKARRPKQAGPCHTSSLM